MTELIQKAKDKKRELSNRFVSICGINIDTKAYGEKFHVTRKVDGEFNLLVFNGEKAILINSSGTVKENLMILDKVTNHLKSKNIKSLECLVELHINEDEKRCRIYDLLSALADEEQSSIIEISPFEIVLLDGKEYEEYGENIQKLQEIFDISKLKPVKYYYCNSKEELKDTFEQWVREENAEGLIVRNEGGFTYKIKPIHNIDCIILGYTVKNADNRVNVLLIGLMHEDGTIQEIGRVGTGINEEERIEIFEMLQPLAKESKYISTDSDGLAFRLIEPKVIVEIDINDIIVEKKGGFVKSSLLIYDKEEGYKFLGQSNSASLIHPRISRIRNDKEAVYEDVRFEQFSDLKWIQEDAHTKELPKSEIIRKEIFTKESKGKIAIQKFIIFKTNKEEIDKNYFAYTFVYVNFSAGRKEMIKKDVRVSNSLQQMDDIMDQFKEKNIKKGWEATAT